MGNLDLVTQPQVASLPPLYFPPVAHTYVHTGKPQPHTLTAPSLLFLAVYWAIFRPLPVSSHLAGWACSQYKGTGLTLGAYVSVSVCFTVCECKKQQQKKRNHLLVI